MTISVNLRICFATVIICFAITGNAYATDAQEHIEKAQKYLESQETSTAIIELKNAVQKDPASQQARFLLGKTYLSLRDGASAEKEISRSRDLGLQRQQWIIPLGQSYLLQGKSIEALQLLQVEPADSQQLQGRILALHGEAGMLSLQRDSARSDISQALELAPDDELVLTSATRLALLEGDRDSALQHVDKLLAIAPESSDAWIFQGEIYRIDGKYREAVAAFSRALEYSPGAYLAHMGKVYSLIELGNLDKAKQEIAKLEGQLPAATAHLYIKGLEAFRRGELTKAQYALEQALEVVPSHLASRLLLGIVYYSQGNLQQAAAHFEKYVSRAPRHLDIIKLLAAAYMKLGQPERAVRLLDPIAEKGNVEPQLLALLGSAYIKTGNISAGTDYLQRAAQAAPDSAAIRTELAFALLDTGKSELAMPQLQALADMGQGLVRADVLQVLIHIRQRKYDIAIAAAEALARQQPQSPVPYKLLSLAYLGKGDLAAARQQLEYALKIEPRLTTAHISLAQIDEQEGDVSAARGRYESVLEIRPDHVEAMLGMARLAAQAGSQEQALDWVSRARKVNPQALQPGLILIQHFLSTGKPLKALTVANELKEQHPNNPLVLLALGRSRLAAGETASAVNAFEKLVEIAPQQPEAHYLLAQSYLILKDDRKASTTLSQALEMHQQNVPLLLAMASLYLQQNNTTEALEIAEKIKSLVPDSVAGYQLQGDVYRHMANYPRAAESYQQAYQKVPSGQLALLIYETRGKGGEAAAAMQALQDWLERSPDDSQVRFTLASYYQHQGRIKDAIREYELGKEQQPANASLWNNLAWLYLQLDDAISVKYAERAYELAPRSPEIADTLGWALLKYGDPQRGLIILQDAAVRAPHVREIRYHMAVALNKTGRTTEARNELIRLLRDNAPFTGKADAQRLLRELETGR